MPVGTLPKYFVATAPSEAHVSRASDAVRVLDVFRTIPPHGAPDEWAIAVESSGRLVAVPRAQRGELPGPVVGELNAHEVVETVRELDVASFHLFAVDSIEPAGDATGVNDPLQVRGVLFGPFPSEAPLRTHGHLVTTRGEMLEGFARGAAHRFQYAGDVPRHCHHAMFAGEPEERIAAGHGLVLAYPLIGEGGEAGKGGNEIAVLRVLDEVLQAMQDDVRRKGHREGKSFAASTLPVRSREDAVTALEARGFEVDGGTATRKKGGVAGRFVKEEIAVPPEGTVHDFLRAAADALDAIPDWPAPRARAVRERLRLREVSWTPLHGGGLRPVPQSPWQFTIDPATREILSRPPSRFFGETWRRVNLAADPAFTRWNRGAMEVEFEFSPRTATNHAWADYDGDKPGKSAEKGSREALPDGWGRAVIQLANAHLRGGMNGADLSVNFKTRRTVRIRKIVLRAKPPYADAIESAPPRAVSPPPSPVAPPAPASPAAAPAAPIASVSPGNVVVEWLGDALSAWTPLHQVRLEMKDGILFVESLGNDPHLHSPPFRGDSPLSVQLRVRSQGGGDFEIFWTRHDRGGYDGADSIRFPVVHDGEWHEIDVPIVDVVPIKRVRLDPGQVAGSMQFRWIRIIRRVPPPDPAPIPAERVVYFDPRYPSAWIHGSGRIAEVAEKKGFTAVDAPQLRAWMLARIADKQPSVVVMSQDCTPDTVYDSGRSDSLVRRYLQAGGRLAWVGDVPFCTRGFATGRRDWVGGHGREGVLGFETHATSDHPGKPVLTDDGAAWGMKLADRDVAARPANVSDVTTVLTRVGKYYASCWFKNFDPSRPSSGFVRYRTNLQTNDDAEIEDFLRVALHGLG